MVHNFVMFMNNQYVIKSELNEYLREINYSINILINSK